MKRLTFAFALLALLAAPAWSVSLDVIGAAAFTGNFGLRVTIDDTANGFVQDDSPNSETVYRATFKVRNNLTQVNGSAHNFFRARMPGQPIFLAQAVRDFGGNYVVYAVAYNDAGAVAGTFATFLNLNNELTFEWAAASAPGANDGIFRMYKGANLRGEITNLDNDTHAVDTVQMGAFGGVDGTTTGTMDFDDFESFRTMLP
ncbi:MAG: hypothetical protein MPN21_26335 [Thermoanaerobaculia bacterium]|nr:hypothetical protein [Thermoanaerobaculia bacterium]